MVRWTRGHTILLMVGLLFLMFLSPALAKQYEIGDITRNDLNRTIDILNCTVTAVRAEPSLGTPSGTYTIVDPSQKTIDVRTTQALPSVGKRFNINATVMQNPQNATQLMLMENTRKPVGGGIFSPPMVYILIGGVVLLVLIVVLLVLVLKPPVSAEGPTQYQVAGQMGMGGGMAVPMQNLGGFTPTVAPPPPNVSGDDSTITVRPVPAGAVGGGDDSTIAVTAARAELRATSGPDTGKVFPLMMPTVLIGRDGVGARRNHVSLTDKSVSREQARVIIDTANKTFNLINESSTNKAKVNGAPVDSAILKNGDELEFGMTKLKFQDLTPVS